jgi:hypothetical protein
MDDSFRGDELFVCFYSVLTLNWHRLYYHYNMPSLSLLDAQLLLSSLDLSDAEVRAEDSSSSKAARCFLSLLDEAPVRLFAIDHVLSASHTQPCACTYSISKPKDDC